MWYMVRHVVDPMKGNWTNFYGPFRTKDTAQGFVDRKRRLVPEDDYLSIDPLIPPADFVTGH